MLQNDNRDYNDLEVFIEQSPLSILLGSFDFCPKLNQPYQDHKLAAYKKISRIGYLAALERYNREQVTHSSINNYIKSKCEKVYNSIIERRLAYMLDIAYKQCENDKNTLAFSHRKVGWTNPEFKLGDDFDVIFLTNFGYGSVSYFFLNIRYQGLDLIPYSDWIRYRLCNKYDFIRYTRKYPLENYSWNSVMRLAVDVYNYSITDPNNFVEKWIISECEEMVKGLENLLNNKKNYKVINSFSNHLKYEYDKKKVPYETIYDREFLDFKGEKISGALSFLEKIMTLQGIFENIEDFITRIVKCNSFIYTQLKSEIKQIKRNISVLKSKIHNIQPKAELYDKVWAEFVKKRDEIELDFKQNYPDSSYGDLNTMILQVVDELYSEIVAKKIKFQPFHDEYIHLTSNLNAEEKWETKFKAHVDVIEKYFEEVGAS